MNPSFLNLHPPRAPSPPVPVTNTALWHRTHKRETTHLGVKFHFCAKQLGVDGHQLSVPVVEVTLNTAADKRVYWSQFKDGASSCYGAGRTNRDVKYVNCKHSPRVCQFQQWSHDASCSLEGPAKETNLTELRKPNAYRVELNQTVQFDFNDPEAFAQMETELYISVDS